MGIQLCLCQLTQEEQEAEDEEAEEEEEKVQEKEEDDETGGLSQRLRIAIHISRLHKRKDSFRFDMSFFFSFFRGFSANDA